MLKIRGSQKQGKVCAKKHPRMHEIAPFLLKKFL